MSLVTGMAIYFTIWWLTLFLVLPFGVKRDENVEKGNDPGAPVRHQIFLKLFINTVLAFIVWSIVYVIGAYDVIRFVV